MAETISFGAIEFSVPMYDAQGVRDYVGSVDDSNDEALAMVVARLDSNDERMDSLREYVDSNDLAIRTEVAERLSSVYRYRGSVPSYSDLPSAGMEPGDVWNVEQDSNDAGMNYAWAAGSNDDGRWDPLGPSLAGYATREYVDSAAAAMSARIDSNDAGISSLESGKASVADATLNERFSDWTVEPAGGEGVFIHRIVPKNPGGGVWVPVVWDPDSPDGMTAVGDPIGDDTSTSLQWVNGETSGRTFSATRSVLPGYVLGSQAEKPIPKLSDVPAVDGTLEVQGAAADAKATGDALGGKLDMAGGTMTGRLEMHALGHTLYDVSDQSFSGSVASTRTNLTQAIERGDEDVLLRFTGTFYFDAYNNDYDEYVAHQVEVDTEVWIRTNGYITTLELDGIEFAVSLDNYDGSYELTFYSDNAYFSVYFSDEYEAVENVRDKLGPVATEDDAQLIAQEKIDEASPNILSQASTSAQSIVNTHNTAANAHSALFANLPFVDPTISIYRKKIPGWDGETLYNRSYLLDDYSSEATQRTRTFKIPTTSVAEGRITELMFFAFGNNVGMSSKIKLSLGDQSVVDLVDLSTLRPVGSNNKLIVYFKLLSIYDSLLVIERKKLFLTDFQNTPMLLEDF